MSANDRNETPRPGLDREVDAAVREATAGMSPEEAAAVRERILRRLQEEVERERRAAGRRDEDRRKREEAEGREADRALHEGERFTRFNRNFRFQHMVMFSSVIVLIITGMPLKFPEFTLSQVIVNLWGGVENSTLVHRVGAVMLIYFMVHHLFYTVLTREGRRDFLLLIPGPKDAKDAATNIRHFLGKSDEKPRFGRFSYIEKFDYWAVYWGCVIMIGSGLFLWFEEVVLRFLPKWALDVAHEMHSDEALLATLAIVVWHFYNVHFNPDRFPGSLMWWHGQITEHEIREEHPLEYEEIMARRAKEPGAEVTPR